MALETNDSDPFAASSAEKLGRRALSVSQYKQFERCAYSWYLARVKLAWQRPAAWLPQGSAEHTVFELVARGDFSMSLEEAQALFTQEYSKEVAEYTKITPNFEWWSKSGPYGGKRDLERRYKLGLEQIERFYAWWEKTPHEVIWTTPDGKPAIELEFNMDLDGVLVRGYIDAVVVNQNKSVTNYKGLGAHFSGDDRGDRQPEEVPWLVVRDYKSGNQPGDDFQLAVYAVAIQDMYGTFGPYEGDYWMGRTGKPTYPYDLRDWTREKVTEKFHELEENIQAGNFDPTPSASACAFCDVRDACEFRMA